VVTARVHEPKRIRRSDVESEVEYPDIDAEPEPETEPASEPEAEPATEPEPEPATEPEPEPKTDNPESAGHNGSSLSTASYVSFMFPLVTAALIKKCIL